MSEEARDVLKESEDNLNEAKRLRQEAKDILAEAEESLEKAKFLKNEAEKLLNKAVEIVSQINKPALARPEYYDHAISLIRDVKAWKVRSESEEEE